MDNNCHQCNSDGDGLFTFAIVQNKLSDSDFNDKRRIGI
jgi:hypothetical protein